MLRKTFAVLAYMDVGQGRKQDAEALRLGERKNLSCVETMICKLGSADARYSIY
jgi:hypothetical protein